MLGFVDNLHNGTLSGWHISGSANEVDIYINGEFKQTIQSHHFRGDLKEKGISADGLAGFSVKLSLQPFDKVEAFCHQSGQALHGSPRVYTQAGWFNALELQSLPFFKQVPFAELLDWPEQNITLSKARVNVLLNNQQHIVGLKVQTLAEKAREESIQKKFAVLIKPESSLLLNLRADELLQETHILHPKILSYKRFQENALVLFDYVPGKVIAKIKRPEFILKSEDLKQLMLNLHAVKTDGLLKLSIQHRFKNFYFKLLCLSFRSLLKLKLNDFFFALNILLKMFLSPKCFAHGDLHPDNLLVSETALYLLDWDRYGLFPLGFDWSYLCGSAELDPGMFDDYDLLIERYGQSLGLNKYQQNKLRKNFWLMVYSRKWLHSNDFTKSNLAKAIKAKIKTIELK